MGQSVFGTAGKEAGEWVGGGLGAIADGMFGYYTPADGHGEMSTPQQGAGLSTPQGTSADADQINPMTTDTTPHPNMSIDPGMSTGQMQPGHDDGPDPAMSMPPHAR
jgi:hypothetical protein